MIAKDIGDYIVYSDGRMWSKFKQEFKIPTCRNGYLSFCYKHDGKHQNVRVNRLIATHFIPNPNNLPQVNHINGIKDDNRVENLEWVTCSDNIKHAFRTGLRTMKGISHNRNKFDNAGIIAMRDAAKAGYKHKDIAAYFKTNKVYVSQIHRRLAWTHI